MKHSYNIQHQGTFRHFESAARLEHFIQTSNEHGMTLIEAMIAIFIFMVIMVGGMNYFTLPKSTIVQQKSKRLAVAAAHQQMEALAALSYVQISTALNETATVIPLGNITGTRATTVRLVDDPADGTGRRDRDGNVVDYKTYTVKISWGKDKSISFSSARSDFGN